MGSRVPLRILGAVVAVSAMAVMAGCSGTKSAPTAARAGEQVAANAVDAGVLPDLVLKPIANAARLPISTEIGTQVTNGTVSSVTLVSAAGRAVAGAMRPDGSSWVPATPLRYGESYTATVTATGPGGRTQTSTTSFTTMPAPTTRPITTSVNVSDGGTYGVGMPIVIDFGASIPATDRAAIQARLFVSSMPAQLGAWRWYSDREVMYRPQSYWKPGTTLAVRAALAGVPVGQRVLGKDTTVTAKIGRDMEFKVTNADHALTVTSNGKVLHQYPISMGKPSTPSWSGHFVIMERDYYTVFDTLDEGPGGYRIPVNFAERLTWSGTFIHSAPWSVYAQGSFNVSHGCVNVGPTNAKWIFQNSLIGDPVSISGTPVHVAAGNGWTVWDMSWQNYIKDSPLPPALTVPAALVPPVK
jgi:lipoprotein-anchoring transpeptidase ErfK/SrfK